MFGHCQDDRKSRGTSREKRGERRGEKKSGEIGLVGREIECFESGADIGDRENNSECRKQFFTLSTSIKKPKMNTKTERNWERIASARQPTKASSSKARQRSISSHDKHLKTQGETINENKKSKEDRMMSFSIDLGRFNNQSSAIHRSIDFDNKNGAEKNLKQDNENSLTKQMNHNCITIKPWLSRKDNPILKRQVNLFQFYMNQLKRKREEKCTRRSIFEEESKNGSPIVIKSIGNSIGQINDRELQRMEQMYKQWKRKSKMLVSGRALNSSIYKTTRKTYTPQKTTNQKKNNLTVNETKKIQIKLAVEEAEIEAWKDQKNVDHFDYAQFS